MRRLLTQSIRCHALLRLLALVLLMTLAAYGQSLGDVARENQQKKAATAPTTPPKVITNKDLPKDPDGDSSPPPDKAQTQALAANRKAAEQQAAQQRAAEQRAAAQWKQKILAQEYTIANLQARVDRIKASIHPVDPNIYSDGLVYTRYQARQLERLKEVEQQLGQQKKVLEDMQDAARHAGMHTPVYDP